MGNEASVGERQHLKMPVPVPNYIEKENTSLGADLDDPRSPTARLERTPKKLWPVPVAPAAENLEAVRTAGRKIAGEEDLRHDSPLRLGFRAVEDMRAQYKSGLPLSPIAMRVNRFNSTSPYASPASRRTASMASSNSNNTMSFQ